MTAPTVGATADRPRVRKVLLGALGGEGGGVLADWLAEAARAAGLRVQSTSIPGVAQRTGATTYYLEMLEQGAPPAAGSAPADTAHGGPVLGLYPGPGDVDLVVTSELLEAGRALELGFVTPERTTLVTSSHRVFAVVEKAAMADGRFETDRLVAAAQALAARLIMADLRAAARRCGAQVNAVALGAISASGALPMEASHYEHAIRSGAKAVSANLRGFAAGRALVVAAADSPATAPAGPAPAGGHGPLTRWALASFAEDLHGTLLAAIARLTDYQGARYARTYLERLQAVHAAELAAGARPAPATGGECSVSARLARSLAVWMCYEDLPRVAQLKSRAARYADIRREKGAAAGEPVRVTEFFRPGAEEVASLLPPAGARLVRRLAGRWPVLERGFGLRMRSDTVTGMVLLRAVAAARRWRPGSSRFAVEDALIERWLAAVRQALSVDAALALEAVRLAELNKGYASTFARGRGNFLRLFEGLLEPALAEGRTQGVAQALAAARGAALADAEGQALNAVLVAPPSLPTRAA